MAIKVGTPQGDGLVGNSSDERNIIYGLGGDDRLYGTGGLDELYGGDGNDRLDGRGVDDGLGGTTDLLVGGWGNDLYFVQSDRSYISELDDEGIDTVVSSAVYFQLSNNVENMSLVGSGWFGYGNSLNNIISGNSRDNAIFGPDGADALSSADGADVIYGGTGSDWIRGGNGADFLVGEEGADKFVYYDTTEATSIEHDTITDFDGIASGVAAAARDRIDLHRIDADTSTPIDEAFRFIGLADFTGMAGELRIVAETLNVVDPNPDWFFPSEPYSYDAPGYIVEWDVNGDSLADFQLAVASDHPLYAGDFSL